MSNNNIPLIWRNELPQGDCDDGRPLLLYNEPHYKSQSNLSPAEAAEFAMQYQDWHGPIYCCGVFFNDNGWAWFQEFLKVYEGRLDGIHLHVYVVSWNNGNYIYDLGPRWREIADQHGWDIIISEWSALGISQSDTAERNQKILPLLVDVFRPSMMFYFSWYYNWVNSDLADSNGNLTPVGKWFFEMENGKSALWLPTISR